MKYIAVSTEYRNGIYTYLYVSGKYMYSYNIEEAKEFHTLEEAEAFTRVWIADLVMIMTLNEAYVMKVMGS